MREYRTLGPPGTGKTTWLTRQIEKAASKYGAENIMVSSFTKAAASELNRRQLPIPKEAIGTLHALCYRALDKPEIAEMHIKEWNEQFPHYALSGDSNVMDEMGADISFNTDADKFLAEYNLCRAKMGELITLPPKVITFLKVWERWKQDNNYIDFTDMIFIVAQMKEPPPGEPMVSFFDEVQDFNPLQMKLIRHWMQFQKFIVCSGDDDQTLYSWSGASSDALIYPIIPQDQIIVLRQSYRLPRVIQDHATKWIKQVSNRVPKEFQPRDEEGELREMRGSKYEHPERVVEEAMKYVEKGKTVMFLTSCSYMLNPLKTILRQEGLPFWNPYRASRGDWNPLGSFKKSTKNRISTKDRFLAFMNTPDAVSGPSLWHIHDLAMWTDIIKSKGILQKKAKERIQEANEGIAMYDPETLMNFYKEVFDPYALERALKRDIHWFRENILASKKSVLSYPIQIYEKRGPEALTEKPKISIGTVHCSPGDEQVLTTDGYVQMKNLNPARHRLASYMSKCNRLAWGGRNSRDGEPRKDMGYPFVIAKNPYDGDMITLKTDLSVTRVTPNHKLQIRFNDHFFEKWVVYLMKRNDWWRVGICVSGHRPYRSGGIAGRLATEQGDCAWILKVCCSREEAIIEEAKIQSTFGIPGLTFEASKSRTLSSEQLHESTKSHINGRIDQLFESFRLLKEIPLWTRQTDVTQKRNMRGMFLTVATNVIDKYMEILTVDESFVTNRYNRNCVNKPTWKRLNVSREHFKGDVYSLEVLPHHHYISGGAIVHNSVKGGEADCSPYDEPVLTVNRGYVPIGELDPDKDGLASFNSDHHKIHRGGPCRPKGYKFTKSSRPYDGDLLTIKTEISRTRITPNHHLTVRWKDCHTKKWVVYLMRKGSWYRIGVAQLHYGGKARGASGVLARLRREHADAAWILDIFDNLHDALFFEQLYSNKYNIPDLTFEQQSRSENQLSSQDLREIWNQIDPDSMFRNAQELLSSLGKDIRYPIWDYSGDNRRIRQAGVRCRWITRACNLLPGHMELPCDPGHGINPKWCDFTITRSHYVGKVYSLDVERWHHYVSGGTVVHNCVFLWPDISLAGMKEMSNQEGKDSVIRMFYVGMTRAKESLILCEPSSNLRMKLI